MRLGSGIPIEGNALDELNGPPALRLLGPSFDAEKHGAYVEYLVDAVEAGARNIALAGAYSAGKSSVLLGLKNALLDHKVVEVSLTNLNRSEAELNEAHGEPNLSAVLQKEVVKRLLYSADPSELPLSKFNRIRPFRPLWALPRAMLLSVGLLIGFYFFTSPDQVATLLLFPGADAQPWVIRLLGVATAIMLGMWLLSGFRLRELSVGPAKLQLTKEGGTYFDEYLDELVYFFRKTGTSAVIFEDLDRFNDPGIFQSLRDLNNVLNAAASIKQSIVFVYAVRDSLFDRANVNAQTIDGVAGNLAEARVKAVDESARVGVDSPASDRAKFFDLIIPIVPFISHEVSSDLMRDALFDLPEDQRPSDDLVALGGRFFTDMRLIHSIRNEYIVFSAALLEKPMVEGLTPDGLFAMVLYKHSHLQDFERIRVGQSKLDQLVSLISDTTSERLSALDRSIAATINDLEAARAAGKRSIKAGERLLGNLDYVFRVLSRYSGSTVQSITLGGVAYQRAEVTTAAFWESLAGHSGDAIIHLTSGHAPTVSTEQIANWSGIDEALGSWVKLDVQDLTARLQNLRSTRAALLAASFTEKVTTDRLDGVGADGTKVIAFERIRNLLRDELAIELVRSGYIDNNFALYTTFYYGGFVSSRARSFMLQAIDKQRSEPLFPLLEEDIDVLLARVKTGFLGTPSALNVAVFDTLLGDTRLNPTLQRIATGTLDGDSSFVETYLTNGAQPKRLLSLLTPLWNRVIDIIAESDRLANEAKRTFVDTALSNLSRDVEYNVSDDARDFLKQVIDEIPLLSQDLSDSSSSALARVLGKNNVLVANLSRVKAPTRKKLAAHRAFEITRDNLNALAPSSGGIGLDSFADFGSEVRDYLLDNIAQYLTALNASSPPAFSLDDPKRMAELLGVLADLEVEAIDEIVKRTSDKATLGTVEEAPTQTWKSLAKHQRFAPTVANLCAYLDAHEIQVLDQELSTLLTAVEKIEAADVASEADKIRVAMAVINGRSLTPTNKLKLVESLDLEDYLDIRALSLADDDLLGELIAGLHIQDSAQTFNHFRNLAWSTRERAIARSRKFPSFITEVELTSSDLDALVQSTTIPRDVKIAVLDNVEHFRELLTRASSTLLVELALVEGIELGQSKIQALVAGRAPSTRVASLIGKYGDHLTGDEIVAVLRSLGDPFRKLSSPNGTRPRLPDVENIRALLERLVSMNLVSQYRDGSNGSIQVYMKRKPA